MTYRSFRDNRPLQCMLAWFVLFWVAMAINPVDRHDWMLENILVVLITATLAVFYKHLKLSNLSYFLIAIFLTLHLIGAHYTYSEVPFGHDLAKWFGTERNHFDRIVHFSFGLLITYPIYEALRNATRISGWLRYYLPVDVILATSALFELIEWLIVELVHPELGMAYLGTQGDVWDAHKDMMLATIGSISVIVIVALHNYFKRYSGGKATEY